MSDEDLYIRAAKIADDFFGGVFTLPFDFFSFNDCFSIEDIL